MNKNSLALKTNGSDLFTSPKSSEMREVVSTLNKRKVIQNTQVRYLDDMTLAVARKLRKCLVLFPLTMTG